MENDQESPNVNTQKLFSWKAPLRAYKKRSHNILRFYLALALLISLIVFFFGDRILLIPILSLLFLFYVLTITPPPEVDHVVTTFGIEAAGVTLRWELLSHFYFTKRFGFDILTVVSHPPYNYHAYLVVPNEEVKTNVLHLFSRHLLYMEKAPHNITDKMVNLLSKLIPDDDDHTTKPDPGSLHQKPMPASL
ncbi:MAG: hypothetical protein WC489_00985 [Patescibacteria group bacterium]